MGVGVPTRLKDYIVGRRYYIVRVQIIIVIADKAILYLVAFPTVSATLGLWVDDSRMAHGEIFSPCLASPHLDLITNADVLIR